MSSFGSIIKSNNKLNNILNSLVARPPEGDSLQQAEISAAIAGSAIRGADKAANIKRLGRRGLPDFPGIGMIPEIIVGSPALILLDSDAYERARMLGAAYRSAVWDRFNLESQFLLYGKPGKNPAYPLLVQAAVFMVENDIPPVAWTLFSFDVWKDIPGTTTPPSVKWTFSVNRLSSRLSWFENEREHYCVHRSRIGPLHAKLMRDWYAMWDDLLVKNPQTRDQVLDIVEFHFPEDSYENRLISAKSEVVRIQTEIDRLVGEGGELWT